MIAIIKRHTFSRSIYFELSHIRLNSTNFNQLFWVDYEVLSWYTPLLGLLNWLHSWLLLLIVWMHWRIVDNRQMLRLVDIFLLWMLLSHIEYILLWLLILYLLLFGIIHNFIMCSNLIARLIDSNLLLNLFKLVFNAFDLLNQHSLQFSIRNIINSILYFIDFFL